MLQNCSICLGPMKISHCLKGCKHRFHQECIAKWLKNNTGCPLCRRFLSYTFLEGGMTHFPNEYRTFGLQCAAINTEHLILQFTRKQLKISLHQIKRVHVFTNQRKVIFFWGKAPFIKTSLICKNPHDFLKFKDEIFGKNNTREVVI